MKKYLLMLFAAVLAVASYAQRPLTLNKLQPVDQKQVTLTSKQKNHVIGKVNGRNIMLQTKAVPSKKMAVQKKADLRVQKNLQQTAMRQLRTSIKQQPELNQKVKIVNKATASKARKAPRKIGGTELVAAPDGLETETFTLMSFSYLSFSEVKYDVQVGFVGNDVYVQGMFSSAPQSWVKGTIDGATVTFAKDQYLGEVEAFDNYSGESMGMMPTWLEYSADMESYTDLVLKYDPETRTMSDVAGGFLFMATNDDFEALDALKGTVISPDGAGDGGKELVTPPATAEVKAVDISYTSLSSQKASSVTGMMAIDGNDIYVAGLCPDMGTPWVKGTLGADGVVTFPSGQYVGTYMGFYDIYFTSISVEEAMVSEDPSLFDAKAYWDPEEQSLIFDEDCWLVENASPVTLMYLDILMDVSVYPITDDRGLVIPPAGLETVEYKTTIGSAGHDAGSYSEYWPYTVKIGFDGNDAYVQGLLYFAPGAWLKGTVDADGNITLPNNQYLGTVQGYDIYVVSCDDLENILGDIVLKYDAENDRYTYNEMNTNISFSVSPNTTDAVEIIYNVVLQGPNGGGDNPGGGDEIDTTVITEQPEGEVATYARKGGAYYTFWGYVIEETQSGTSIRVVTAPDGKTVYMENPISIAQVEGGVWVKGTKEGNKIHMPLKQCILYSEEEGYGYMTGAFTPKMLYDANYDEYYYDYVMTDDKEVTFTIGEDGTITLDQTAEVDEETGLASFVYGLAFTDDFGWGGYADYNSVYVPFNEVATTIPEGLETEEWAFMYSDGNYDNAEMVQVAIDGDKMYIAGVSAQDPESAIVGTIGDGKVTFQSDQFLGLGSGFISYCTFANVTIEQLYDDYYDEYYDDINYSFIPEYSFTYNVERKMLTSASDIALLVNAGKGADATSPVVACIQPKFNYFEDKVATPADPEIQGFNNWFDDYGYDMLGCNVKLEDVDGNYIDQNKLFYIVWVKVDGKPEPFTFYVDEYVGLADYDLEEITEIPFNFTSYDEQGYEDIYVGGSNIVIYETGFDDYGIQTIYYGGGQRTESNIVWLSSIDGSGTGVQGIETGKQTAAAYNALGQRVDNNYRGLVIKNGKKFVNK